MQPRWNCKNTFLKSSFFATRPKKSELLFAFDRLLTTSDERNGVSCKILEICFRWKFWIILEIWDLNDGRFWKYGICRYWKIYFTRWEVEDLRWARPTGRRSSKTRKRLVSGFRGQMKLGRLWRWSHHDHWCPLQSPILWFLTSSSLRLRHPFPASLQSQPMSPTTSW